MKIKLMSEMLDIKIEEDINDDGYESESDEVKIDTNKFKYFFENYDRLTKRDYYNMICNFYDIRLEDNDYIDYINYKNNSNYDRVVSIATDVINKDIQREGHGRDFSWWTVSYRMYLKVAVLGELENSDKFYTINEIKELIKNGKIYPIDWYVLECDDRLYENRCKNDIDYLVKCEYGRKDGQISINDEYFDYFINKILGEIKIDDIFRNIRSFLVDSRNNLECSLIYYYDYYEDIEPSKELIIVNKIIDIFNEKIVSLNKENDCDIEMISTNKIEMLFKYLNSLFNDDDSKWYKDVTFEQVVSIICSLNYDENKELCDEIKKIIIDLGDSELCYEMFCNVDWIDENIMLDLIIDSGDEDICYKVVTNYKLDEGTRRRLIQVIIDSGDEEVNYNLVEKGNLDFIDVREHGKVVIDSKNVWYNFLFAQLDGADVKAHGEVIMEYGSVYDNNTFCSYVDGADIEKHREVIRIKLLEEEQENKNNLKKVRKK